MQTEPQLNHEQQRAVELMMCEENVFLTGKAGSGKSSVLKCLKKLKSEGVAWLAPTGMAALHIGGCTIHRYFELPTGLLLPEYVDCLAPHMCDVVRHTQTIVIDEISMVRSDVFYTMDAILRKLAPPSHQNLPFGGKQMIVVGDFGQLPPVVLDHEKEYLDATYGGAYAFETLAWRRAGFKNFTLHNAYRHAGDVEFLAILDSIRDGNTDFTRPSVEDCIKRLNTRVRITSNPDDGMVSLCSTRRLADAINNVKHVIISGPVFTSQASVTGSFDQDILPTASLLRLKIGSRVMLCANNVSHPGQLDYVNGDLGLLVRMDQVGQAADILLDSGRYVRVSRHTWLNQRYEVVEDEFTGHPTLQAQIIGTFTQFPLMLADAITIHKSQGMTLPRAHVALGQNLFACGQLYTALSRCRSADSLSLDRPLRLDDITLDPKVVEFNRQMERDPDSSMFGGYFIDSHYRSYTYKCDPGLLTVA